MSKSKNEHTYYVEGMHCASCEILIEKKLLGLKNVKSADASVAKGQVLIEYSGEKPSVGKLNKIFKEEGYIFLNQPKETKSHFKLEDFSIALGVAAVIILGFVGLNKLGLSGLVNVTSKSSLLAFFVFGLLAGSSSCSALVGGMILSMTKNWTELSSYSDSIWKKVQPNLAFNIGRIISYAFFGAVLGAVGNSLNLSFKFGPILIIIVSFVMIFLGLQMLGLEIARRFQFTMPKFITRYIVGNSSFKKGYMPFLMGFLTFFLPCGFTITAQSLALVSGSAVQGSLIMLSFALGTLPILLFIGLSAVKFSQNHNLSESFFKVAGILVLFFAFYNINAQLNVLGFSVLDSFAINLASKKELSRGDREDLPPVVGGKQILKMDASSFGYSPNYFKVRAGVPVRWEITDKGTSGCTNAIISRDLFEGEITLNLGQTSVKEFIPPDKPGKYKFSCWMGMVSGIIEVVGKNN